MKAAKRRKTSWSRRPVCRGALGGAVGAVGALGAVGAVVGAAEETYLKTGRGRHEDKETDCQ